MDLEVETAETSSPGKQTTNDSLSRANFGAITPSLHIEYEVGPGPTSVHKVVVFA